MKKHPGTLSLILCVLTLLFMLTGCNKPAESTNEPQEPTASEGASGHSSASPTTSRDSSETSHSSSDEPSTSRESSETSQSPSDEPGPSSAPVEQPTPEPSVSTPGMPSVFDLSQEDADGLVEIGEIGFSPRVCTWLIYQSPETNYTIQSIRVSEIFVDDTPAKEFRQAACDEELNIGFECWQIKIESYRQTILQSWWSEEVDPDKASDLFTVHNPLEEKNEKDCVYLQSDGADYSCYEKVIIKCRLTLEGYEGELPYTFTCWWHPCFGIGGTEVPLEAYR